MDETRASQLARIRGYCAAALRPILFDEPGGLLMDVASAKTLQLDAPNLTAVEERVNPSTRAPYLLLVYGDGRQFALAEIGVAFAPQFHNTGPLPELPEVVCFRDHATLLGRLKHELYGHLERAPTKETVKLLMMCIAVIDGARAVGFDVGREEKDLDSHLAELEKRAPKPTS